LLKATAGYRVYQVHPPCHVKKLERGNCFNAADSNSNKFKVYRINKSTEKYMAHKGLTRVEYNMA